MRILQMLIVYLVCFHKVSIKAVVVDDITDSVGDIVHYHRQTFWPQQGRVTR